MNDNLFSFCCSKCGNSLFSAFIFNPMFFFKASCPYCSAQTKLATIPTLLVVLGAALNISSILSLFYGFDLYLEGLEGYALGLGLACFIFGIVFLRFIEVKSKKMKNQKSATHITYSH